MLDIDIQEILNIAKEAGEKILEIYTRDFIVETKKDQSPLTEADKASHEVIFKNLTQLYPNITVLSEEGKDFPYEERKNWESFWLVDPLDGTKEFIKKNGEFTVNIALIEGEYPVLGVIYLPVLGIFYFGIKDKGAYKIDSDGKISEIKVNEPSTKNITIVESRSHPSKDLEEFLNSLNKHYSSIERLQRGSSLKLCAVAEGLADIYPRLGPTMEWDIAAGQAIIEAAGGKVAKLDGERFKYNKENLKNDYFLAYGKLLKDNLFN